MAPRGDMKIGEVHRLLPRYGFIVVDGVSYLLLPSAVCPPVTYGALRPGMRVRFVEVHHPEKGLRARSVTVIQES